jgi:hypothetical protein
MALKSRPGAALALVQLAAAGTLLAQSNTGSIIGRATDPAGHPVAGVRIVIKNTDLSTTRTTLTDAHGEFRVAGLVPGALTVEGKGKGLASRRPVRATLGLGSTAYVALALRVPVVEQKATVSAVRDTAEGNTLALPVNTDEPSVSSFFAGQTVTYLPNRDRDFTQFGQLGAGVTEDSDGTGVIVAGQRGNALITQVDGVSFNDPLQGGPRGAQDGTFFLPQTVVREFQIVRSGVTAEVGNTNAGLISVATKEGSNKIHGEAFVTSRPGWAGSADAFGHKLDNRQTMFGGSSGGAIVPARAFYYGGFEQDFLLVPYDVEFEPQAAGTAAPGQLAGLQGAVDAQQSPGAVSARFDAVPNQANTVNVLLMANRVRGSELGDGSTRSIATADHAHSLSGQSIWSKVGLTTVVTSESVNQLVVSWSQDHRNLTPNSTAPEQVIHGFGTLGGDALGPQIYTSAQFQVGETLSMSLRGASLDIGGTLALSPAYEQQEANLNGRFDYDSLANYLANQPRRYQQTFVAGDTRYCGTVGELGLFADGKLPLGRKLTLSAGLRWDGQWNPQPQLPGALSQTQRIPSDLAQWQPRLGLAWTLFAKTVVRLSAGMYDAPTPATIFHRVNADNGMKTVVADSYFDPQILGPATGETQAPVAPAAGLTVPEALLIGIDPGFRNPRSMQLAGTVEQQILPQWTLSAGYLHDSTWRLQRRLDENLYPPAAVVAGLPIFPLNRPDASIGRLMVNQSTAHSSYDGLLLSAVAQPWRRSQLSVNYTLSGTWDDDSSTGPYGIDAALDPFDLRLERAFSLLDVRHTLNVSAIFNLPLGLKCNPVFIARSGQPYTPIIGFDTQHDQNDWNGRALINGTTAGRDSMRQPSFSDADLRMVKDFTLKGTGHHLDLFLDVFNLLGAGNRDFGRESVSLYGDSAAPVASAGQPLFAPDGTAMGGPRVLQFTARLVGF